MDEKEFQSEWKRIHDEHDRIMQLIAKLPPPTEEQKQEVQRYIADLDRRFEEGKRQQEERERRREEEALEAQRRREADPSYWRFRYERLLAKLEEDEKEKERQREIWLSVLAMTAVAAVIVMILSAFGLL